LRYITNGTYLNIMRDMLAGDVSVGMEPLKARISAMVERYAAAVEAQKEDKDEEKMDFAGRHLYDMTAVILCSLLLVADASRAPELFGRSAHVYVRLAEGEVARNVAFLGTVNAGELANYRQE
ncbi:MAG: acyl-CoA dehydrogenase, partial [Bacteroidales bacterium]|nr:acyl-CoA dehydrogenase [Bacteroidales bacterium]